MGTINVKSNLTGRTYPILIAGSTPNADEDNYIQQYVNRQDGVNLEAPIEKVEDEEGLIPFAKSLIGGIGRDIGNVPGGLASTGEAYLGYDVGKTGIGSFAQDISKKSSEFFTDKFDLNNQSISSKSGQAGASLITFLAGGMFAGKVAKTAGAGAKAQRNAALGTAAVQGSALSSQDQMNRMANFIENGGEIDEDTKRSAVKLSALLGVSEAIPFATTFKTLGAAMKVLKKVPKDKQDLALRYLSQRLKRSLYAGVGEGAQEAIAGYMQDMIENKLYNPDLEPGQSVYDDAVYGGGAGAVLNLIVNSIRGRQINKYYGKQKQLDDDQNEEAQSNSSKLKNAEDYLKAEETLMLEGPALGLPSPEPDVILSEEDKKSKLITDQRVASVINKKEVEAEKTLKAAREARTPYNPIKLESLPQDEAQKIRKNRIQLGSKTPVDDPVTLQELSSVVGEEASFRESYIQKPSLNTGPLTTEELFEDPSIQEEFKDIIPEMKVFTERLLKSKTINKNTVKSLHLKVFKQKINDDQAEATLNGLLAGGAIEYKGRGLYTGKQADVSIDLNAQSAGLAAQAQRIRDNENTLRNQQEKVVDDPIQFETYKQQLDILQKQYSDIQVEAFALEKKADTLSKGQQNIKATRIAPPFTPKKVFDQAPKAEPTPDYKLKQKRVLSALRRELARIGLGDVSLDGRDILDKAELQRDLASGIPTGITEGQMETSEAGKKIIALSMEIYDPNMTDAELELKLRSVMNHEIIHALRALNLFTEQEYASLVKATQTRKYVKMVKGKPVERQYTYLERSYRMAEDQDLTADQISEEAIAEMYRDYADGKLKVAGKPKTLFQRIVKFIKAIFGSHKNEGFENVDQIFSNIGTTETENQIGRRDRELRSDKDNNDSYEREDVRKSRVHTPKIFDDEEYFQSMPKNIQDGNKAFLNRKLPNNTMVAIRPNLNGFVTLLDGKKQVTQTIHQVTPKGLPNYKDAYGYDHTAVINEGAFDVKQNKRSDIYFGANAKGSKQDKVPMASGIGNIEQLSKEEMQQIITKPDHIFGFNPGFVGNDNRPQVNGTHLFTDTDGYAVKGYKGGKLLFVGNQVYAIGGEPEFWLESQAPKPERNAPSDVRYKNSVERLPNLHPTSIGPLDIAHQVKEKYLKSKNIPIKRPDTYVSVNVDLAKRIANDFDNAINDPTNIDVQESYIAMANETFEQWQFIKETGLKTEFIKPDQTYPYPKGSKDLLLDIRDNNHIWVFPTDNGFGNEEITQEMKDFSPLLRTTGEIIDGIDATYNDIFRIVHDYFGHALEGSTFSPRGEENAWQAHVRMYTPLAAKAMTTETRGQNSWVNYSDAVGDKNRNSKNKAEETQYADQKMTLLSNFVMEEGLANDIQGDLNERSIQGSQRIGQTGSTADDGGGIVGGGTGRGILQEKIGTSYSKSRIPTLSPQKTITLTHFSPIEGLQSIDPEKQQSNLYMRGAERKRGYKGYPARSYFAINIADPNGYNPEQNVGDNVYEIEVPFEGLYDWEGDPSGFQAKALAEQKKELPNVLGEGATNYITTAKERMIKESGKSGYWINTTGRGFVAAVYNELKILETSQPKKYNQAYKDEVNQKRGENATRIMKSRVRTAGEEYTISTRFPTAKSRIEDPLQSMLFANSETIKNNPDLASKAANLIKGYNISQNSKLYDNFSDLEIIEDYIEAMKSNLLFIHDSIDPNIRERSSKWYDGARAIVMRFSEEYGYKPEVIAASMAAQSPQNDWFQNVSVAERVLDISKNHGDVQFTPEMKITALRIFKNEKFKSALNHVMGLTANGSTRNSSSLNSLDFSMHKAMWIRIFDETYNDRGHRIVSPEGEFLDYARTKNGQPKKTGWGSTPEIAKAVRVMDDPSLENISIEMGARHKIRSFYNNIISPMSTDGHVTIDTHAVAAAHMKPLSGKSVEVDHNFGAYTGGKKEGRAAKYGTIPSSSVSGTKGTYGLVAEAYQRAAEERGILPRQMQSITWEAIRGLYSDSFKNNKQKIQSIENIWNRFRDGIIDVDQARQEAINNAAGRFEEPAWDRPSDPISEFSGNSSYERELSRDSLSGRNTRDDIRDGGIASGTSKVSRLRTRATAYSPRQEQEIINDADVEAAQQNIRYDNLSQYIAKILKIVPKGILGGRTRAEAAQRIVTKYQDSFRPVGAMMDELRNKGYTIGDAMDPYLREVNSQGIIGDKLTEMEELLVKPLMEDIKSLDIDENQIEQLARASERAAIEKQGSGFVRKALESSIDPRMALADIFAYARHAKERNRRIQQDHGRPMGSGMTESEATAILSWFDNLDQTNKAKIEKIDQKIKQIVEGTNLTRYEAGLITEEQFNNRKFFDHYVPLRGDMDSVDEFTDDRLNKIRQRFNFFGSVGKEDQAATGRGSNYAENIVVSAIRQHQRAIDRAERNKVGQDLLNLLRGQEEQADGSMATNDALANDMQQNFAEVTDKKDALNPNQLIVKENGQEVYVNFLRSSIARSMKLHYDPKTNANWIRQLAKLNRFLSNVNTSWNPAFMLPNFAKDLETALINIQQHDAEGITKEIALDTGRAIMGIRRVLRGTDDSSYWGQQYKEFVKAGGKNATNQMGNTQDQIENLGNLLNEITNTNKLGIQKNKFTSSLNGLLKFLDDYNTVIENGVRVATFTNLKKRGFSDARAAEAARNVTVNFAKGGEDKVAMNSLYLFYNASLQGSMAIFNAAHKSKKVRKLLGGLIVYGILQDQLMALANDPDDEDEKNQYDRLNDYVLEHNLVFGTFGLSDEKFTSIPLAYGLNMPFNLGRSISRFARGEYTFGQMSSSVFGTTMETLSPFGAIEQWETYLTPTVVDPAISMIANKNYRNAPIYKERPMYASSTVPDAYTHWNNTGGVAKFIAQTINDMTGGDEVESGLLDVSPDTIEFFYEYAIGGVGALVGRSTELVFDVLPKVATGEFDGQIASKIPFARRLLIEPSDRADTQSYLDNKKELSTIFSRLDLARRRGNPKEVQLLFNKYKNEISIHGRFKALDNARNRLLRQIKELERNLQIPEETRKKLVKLRRERIDELMKKGIYLMRQVGIKS